MHRFVTFDVKHIYENLHINCLILVMKLSIFFFISGILIKANTSHGLEKILVLVNSVLSLGHPHETVAALHIASVRSVSFY